MKHYVLLAGLLLIMLPGLHAQNRIDSLSQKLEQMSQEVPGLKDTVQFSVNGVSIQQFLRGIASSNKLNISIDPSLKVMVYNNFSNVTVADVLLFLCKNYNLSIQFTGNIMYVAKYVPPPAPAHKYVPKNLNITYDKNNDLLSFDLERDSLSLVAKKITQLTQKNVVFAPGLGDRLVSGFIEKASFNNAMDKLAFANNLKVTPTKDNFYLIQDNEKINRFNGRGSNGVNGNNGESTGLTYQVDDEKQVTVNAVDEPINKVIEKVSDALKYNYFLFSDIKGKATLNIKKASYEEFLKFLLNGTDYTFRKDSDIYLIGERSLEGLRSTDVFQFKYRTVDKIINVIPGDLKKGVEIKAFPDLNSLVLSGSQPRIVELKKFLRSIDQVVPVVEIEVIIADVSNTTTLATGIEAGLGTAPATTGGTIFPGVNMTLSSSTINDVIDGINGFGTVNLGKVTPNFYITLKALETQGILKMRSTPKLATLNGHKATMSIGQTQYYLETSNNVIGTQNPQNIITQQYKSVNADLSLSIDPIVSGDDQITLDINVKQSSFTSRISPSAPPGKISRDFKSLIRMKNNEMIVLGGLDENTINDSGSGVPFLSRIPVIKWFFSSRTKSKDKSKLTIFIKPTVIY